MDYTFHSGDLALSAHLAEPTIDANDAPGRILPICYENTLLVLLNDAEANIENPLAEGGRD